MATLKKEYLEMIPEFSGEAHLLPRFLEIGEKLVNKFYNADDANDFQNEFLMYGILSKIKGPAAEVVSTSAIKTWDELKRALLNSYSDRRDGYTLTIEMSCMRQSLNESPFEFYERLQKLLNLIIPYWKNHCVEHEVINGYTRNLALRVFLKGLREPIGSLMRTKNPVDLNSALNMLTNDFQFAKEQTRQNFRPVGSSYPTKTLQRPILAQHRSPLFRDQSTTPNRPYQQNSFHQNSSTPLNTNTKRNYTPTPMSISTTNTTPRTNYRKTDHIYNVEDLAADHPCVDTEDQEPVQVFDNSFESFHHDEQNHFLEDVASDEDTN